ncbi:hypothetical protein SAMN05880590_102721 [Rhizobium sp. RU35A]|uniref:hypothetical protein n=1 Tax=Rhizobium sp. RU35A TaxID=1907414 RepID=UPI000953A847|nr:hypothetical protein [Rhizobium sp. RU35A]SIQ23532.1 hypothetical protein SAMN05880590_102721 [Rhizobium sp. RU35A]
MPQAAFADSTTAPKGQQTFQLDFDVFIDTLRELEAICFMLEGALSQTGFIHQDIVAGIHGLIRGRVEDLRVIYGDAMADREAFQRLLAIRQTRSKLDQAGSVQDAKQPSASKQEASA